LPEIPIFKNRNLDGPLKSGVGGLGGLKKSIGPTPTTTAAAKPTGKFGMLKQLAKVDDDVP